VCVCVCLCVWACSVIVIFVVVAVVDVQEDMPKLYHRAHAFVLPSRGEGWGRPHMEALALGTPLIATNWSGPTAYMTNQNSYPLPVAEALVPVKDGPFRGHLWADPVQSELRSLMRRVLDSVTACRLGSDSSLCKEYQQKSKQARQDILEQWTPSRLTVQLMSHLQRIEAGLVGSNTDSSHDEL